MNTATGGDAARESCQPPGAVAGEGVLHPMLTQAILTLLSALVMLLVSNWHRVYEEDQMAKVAQIISINAHSDWMRLPSTIDYYSKDLFSAYYLAAAAFYKATGLPALEALNVLSLVCGVIFFSVMPAFLRRTFNLPPWLSWVALVSAPILLQTLSYGNETAFAMMLAAVAAFVLTFDTPIARIAGAVCYVAAAYSRSDYLFLWPALSFLTIVRTGGKIDRRKSIRNVLFFGGACAVLGAAYLALILRKWPRPETIYFQPSLKLFVAYFAYAPNLVNLLFAFVGLAVCVLTRNLRPLLLLTVFVQCLPYLTRLTSPKYVVPSVVVIVIFAVMGMVPLLKRAPLALAAALALPWMFSLSPFGAFGPVRSAFWYVPTDHGPLPAGGFLGFYARQKAGFYQSRYDQEMNQVGEAMPRFASNAPPAYVVGYFNIQTVRLWAAWHQRWDLPPEHIPFWATDLGEAGEQRDKYMIKTSYLYAFKQTPKLRDQLAEACDSGRLRAATGGDDDPFPDVIQCGDRVPEGADRELGRRILFLNAHYEGNQVIRQGEFVEDYGTVSWMPRNQFEAGEFRSRKPLYSDSKWVCLAENVPEAVYYSMRFPPAYTGARLQMK
jgi:hypothetical protein